MRLQQVEHNRATEQQQSVLGGTVVARQEVGFAGDRKWLQAYEATRAERELTQNIALVNINQDGSVTCGPNSPAGEGGKTRGLAVMDLSLQNLMLLAEAFPLLDK